MRNNKKGFTLVELLVVIAILAILASVAVVGYTAFIEKAEKSNAQTELHQIETSVEANLMVNEATVIGQTKEETPKDVYVGVIVVNNTAKVTSYILGGDDGKTPVEITEATAIKLTGDFEGLLDGEGATLTINGATLSYNEGWNAAETVTFD